VSLYCTHRRINQTNKQEKKKVLTPEIAPDIPYEPERGGTGGHDPILGMKYLL